MAAETRVVQRRSPGATFHVGVVSGGEESTNGAGFAKAGGQMKRRRSRGADVSDGALGVVESLDGVTQSDDVAVFVRGEF